MRHPTLLLIAAAAIVHVVHGHAADSWPIRPIRIIVPAQAGAAPDAAARLIGNALTSAYGQPVVIENKAGAQGLVGSALAKAAPADGYTFVLMTSSNVCGNPYLRKAMTYDVNKDFEPVGLTGASPIMLTMPARLNVKTFHEFIAYARANRGKLSYSTPGIGSAGHLHGEMISKTYDLDLQHVPYPGGASALNAVLAGQVPLSLADLSVQPHIDSGKLVGIAITGDKRWPRLPGIPTLREVGFSTSLLGWMGLMAPAGTPREAVDKVNAVMQKTTSSAVGREALLNMGNIAGTGTPEEMAAEIRNRCPLWGEAVRKANIEPE